MKLPKRKQPEEREGEIPWALSTELVVGVLRGSALALMFYSFVL